MPMTTQAAAFNTRCNLSVIAFDEFARRALQYSQCVTLEMHQRVWMQILHPVNAEADVTNSNMKY